MLKIASIAEVREIEAEADSSGISYDAMMESAGRAIANRTKQLIVNTPDPKITILVGKGNNGGDGLVAARILAAESNAQVRCYLLSDRDDAKFKEVQEKGTFIANAENDKDFRVLRNMVASSDILIDALFGIGIHLPIRKIPAQILRNINRVLNELKEDSLSPELIDPSSTTLLKQPVPYVIAADCPSGLDCDSGEVDQNTMSADETITFIVSKPGLLLFPGAGYAGRVSVAPINVPPELPPVSNLSEFVVDLPLANANLPARSLDGHKGSFGKAFLIAGSANYVGATGLCAEAAYRTGTGLVTVAAIPTVIKRTASTLREPTWLWLPERLGTIASDADKIVMEQILKYDALLLGCGLGREANTGEFIRRLFTNDRQHSRKNSTIGFNQPDESEEDSHQISLPPTVLDADGLVLLSKIENWWEQLPEQTIITPHPGEMAEIIGATVQDVQDNRWQLAHEKAQEWKLCVLLKGAHTVVASPDGRLAVLPFKTDALATAGSGDVLAGTIASLLAQGLTAFEAGYVGAFIHGLSGQLAGEKYNSRSVIASDLLKQYAAAFNLIEGKHSIN